MTLADACRRAVAERPLQAFAGDHGGGYRVIGHGPGVLVVLPGIVGSADALAAIGEALADTHRTCVVHYPSAPSLDGLLAALTAMHARVGGGSLALYGGSFGSLVAQAWLARAPQDGSALIVSGARPPDPARAARNERLLSWLRRRPLPAWRALLGLAVRLSTARAVDRGYWRAFYGEAIDRLRRPDIESRYRIAIDVDRAGPPSPSALAGWRGRMLVLEGARDRLANARHRAALRAVSPAAAVHEVAAAGHGLALEQPAEWLHVVSAFVRGS